MFAEGKILLILPSGRKTEVPADQPEAHKPDSQL